ncbi:hypothetical protein BDR22DRAFT_888067 [Usnea florida]
MEALAAVSLAGNILQFLNFTGAVISKTRQIHASTSGTSKEHDDLEAITVDLKNLASRLQISTEPVGSVLGQLCSSCSEVADELLKSLKHLGVKGKLKRSESFRKALKALWGKEKLRSLEERLAGFRQELILHVAVDLRSQIDLLNLQQIESFQTLDNATKESVQKLSEIVNGIRNQLVTATDGRTEELKELHQKTETILSQEFESAAANLAAESETTRTLATNEQRKTRADVLNAIADVASNYNYANSTQVENISVRIEQGNEKAQAQISKVLEKNQETMRQEINGLQRGLHQLQLEIDRKTEELKEIIIKISTTREGPNRKKLREMGNSATVVLTSLRELYKALEEMLKSLIRQAGTAFGTLFGMRINHSATENRTEFELEAYHGSGFDISFPLYYAYYYEPLVRPWGARLFSTVKMNEWIHKMRLPSDDSCESSLEARAILNFASSRDETLWSMTALVAGLNACLTPEDAMLVLSTALSVRYNSRCLLPACGNCSRGRDSLHCYCMPQEASDVRFQVRRIFEKGSQQMRLKRPRFGLDCNTGKRLVEDFVLMSQLADQCGLQEESSRCFTSSSRMGSQIQQPSGPLTERDKADLTLAVVGLTLQTRPWVRPWVSKAVTHDGSCPEYRMDLDRSASPVARFVDAIHAVGFQPSSPVEGDDLVSYPGLIESDCPNSSSQIVNVAELAEVSWSQLGELAGGERAELQDPAPLTT